MTAIPETQEKAAGVCGAPVAALKANMQLQSLETTREVFKPSAKQFETLRAEFAMHGVGLARCIRADDGSITYVLTKYGGSRYLVHWNDVLAYLSSLGGRT